ncbi:MAG: flagellar biosynthesis anti-sigma factor FlgM [Novosphingobium sp. 12-64-8]|nr:MAG: flagellar biosynthesis anti-sigma factor FlgM [Novosphingobium sp. 12-64-8]
MPPIEIGPMRPVGAVQVKTPVLETNTAPAKVETSAKALPAATVETSDAVKAGPAPVDAERVAQIRHAIQNGTYPVLPTKIADAMIAAGLLLRSAN